MATLYEQDVVLWAEQQGKLLREAAAQARNEPIEWANVAEEIESLGRSQAIEAKSRLFRILEHLLKLEFSPQGDPRRGWLETVGQQRADLAFLLEDSPSLVPRLPELLDRVRERAVLHVAAALEEWGEPDDAARAVRQHQGRYTMAQVLGEDVPRVGLGTVQAAIIWSRGGSGRDNRPATPGRAAFSAEMCRSQLA